MFIVFEGGEGAGKSTQIDRLAQWLTDHGYAVERTREPGGTTFAEAMRTYLLDPDHQLNGLEECYLIAAGRASHVARLIRPALADHKVVVCDRYVYSSYVYQGIAGGLGVETVKAINAHAVGDCHADLVILLDIDPEVGVERARRVKDGGNRIDQASMAFHRQVNEGFRTIADDRWVIIDANHDEDAVFADIIQAVQPLGLG